MPVWSWPGPSQRHLPSGPAAGPQPAVVYRHAPFRELEDVWPEPERARFLSADEWERHNELRASTRRQAWLGGRLLAKRLILDEAVGRDDPARVLHPSRIQIYSRDGLGRGSRPRVMVDGRLLDRSLSIAHSDRSVLVALALTSALSVGVDLVPHRPLADSFVRTWLTPRERGWSRRAGPREPGLPAKLWAVKEAFYKATNAGEPFMPQQVEVRRDGWGAWTVWVDGRAPDPSCGVDVWEASGEVAAIVTAAKRRWCS